MLYMDGNDEQENPMDLTTESGMVTLGMYLGYQGFLKC